MRSGLTEMQEDLSFVPLHAELVFNEEFLVLLLFNLCHNVLSFLRRETVQSSDSDTCATRYLQHRQHAFYKMCFHYQGDLE